MENKKKLNGVQKGTLNLLEKAAEKELKVYSWEWPPSCPSFFHQPKRPKTVK